MLAFEGNSGLGVKGSNVGDRNLFGKNEIPDSSKKWKVSLAQFFLDFLSWKHRKRRLTKQTFPQIRERARQAIIRSFHWWLFSSTASMVWIRVWGNRRFVWIFIITFRNARTSNNFHPNMAPNIMSQYMRYPSLTEWVYKIWSTLPLS